MEAGPRCSLPLYILSARVPILRLTVRSLRWLALAPPQGPTQHVFTTDQPEDSE